LNKFVNILVLVPVLLIVSGCYNNSHIRTQRVLEPGDQVLSLYGSANLAAPEAEYGSYDIKHGGVNGLRIGLSYLGYHRGLEQGVNLAYGGGTGDYHSYILGYDIRKVMQTSGSLPYRYGLYAEMNSLESVYAGAIKGGTVMQFRPYIMTASSRLTEWYGGLHGIMSFGDVRANQYSGDLVYWGDSDLDYEYEYSVSAIGLGVTVGNELQLGPILVQSQFDVSYISQKHTMDSDDLEYLLGLEDAPSFNLNPLDNSGPVFAVGISACAAPESQKRRIRAPAPIPQSLQDGKPAPERFDPLTGQPITEPATPELKRFDPFTGEIITGEELAFDPFTGLPVQNTLPPPDQSFLTPNEATLLRMQGLRVLTINGVPSPGVIQDIRRSGLVISRSIKGEPQLETMAFEHLRSIRFEGGRRGLQKGFKSGATSCGLCVGLPLLASLATGDGSLFFLGVVSAPVVGLGATIVSSLENDTYELSFDPKAGKVISPQYKQQVLTELIKMYLEGGFPSYPLTRD